MTDRPSPADKPTADQFAADAGASDKRVVDPRLLAILVCPVSKRPLHYDTARQELVSPSARLAFPIRDGVPLLTLDAARHLDDEMPTGPASCG